MLWLRALLADMDKNRSAKGADGDGTVAAGELKLDADQDELREKFGIVRVRKSSTTSHARSCYII